MEENDEKVILRVDNQQVIFNVFKAMKHPLTSDTGSQIDILDKHVANIFEVEYPSNPYEAYVAQFELDNLAIKECAIQLPKQTMVKRHWQQESLNANPSLPVPLMKKATTFALKLFPLHLHYAYLGDFFILIVITMNDMIRREKVIGGTKEVQTYTCIDDS